MKAVSLISGGIDSPVAASIAVSKGIEVIFLHGGIGEANTKVEKLVNMIKPRSKVFYLNHRDVLKKIVSSCDKKYTCLICKRSLYRAAEILAKKVGAEFIITGESLGQVASQTLQNLSVLDAATKIPVIRPLIGLNKNDIINHAKKLGTYETSIKDACTCPFVPYKPSTKADLKRVEFEEKKLDIKLEEFFY